MSEKQYNCGKCGARFGSGEGAAEALEGHLESFHPAGAPATVARALAPGATIVEGKDFGPAVSGLATDLGDVKAAVADQGERLKALEEGTRSETDLDALAEQLVSRIQDRLRVPAATSETLTESTTSTEEDPSYADLQARAKELGIPATGTKEALAAAIAAEEANTGQGT